MTDTTTVREHYNAAGLTDRIKRVVRGPDPRLTLEF
jgi:hypothetical protein